MSPEEIYTAVVANVHQILDGVRPLLTEDGAFFGFGLLFLWLILLSLKIRRINSQTGFDRASGLVERMQRLEGRLSDLKLDSAKTIEILKNDIGFVRQEVRDILDNLGDEPPTQRVTSDEIRGEIIDFASSAERLQAEDEPLTLAEFEKSEEPTDLPVAIDEPEKEPLSAKLKKTRAGILDRIKGLFAFRANLNEELLGDLEAILITSDIGVNTAQKLVQELKADVAQGNTVSEESLKAILKLRLLSMLEGGSSAAPLNPFKTVEGPKVVMLVGVNGVGKTTTAGKLAKLWTDEGAKVVLAAADTFRAAAVEQLQEWGRRAGVPVVTGAPDSKPSTVVFDAAKKAVDIGADVLVIDTAGRLHTKTNLMAELEGVRNIVAKHIHGSPHEVLLVLDGTTGQNALNQAREFDSAVKLTGLIVTKLDGTSKGGIVVAIRNELGIPIRYIGVGESVEDLRSFEARDFIEALFEASEIEEDPRATRIIRTRRNTAA